MVAYHLRFISSYHNEFQVKVSKQIEKLVQVMTNEFFKSTNENAVGEVCFWDVFIEFGWRLLTCLFANNIKTIKNLMKATSPLGLNHQLKKEKSND